jgi:predicted flap endonuclease-1-like 5' DNA nuclease
MTLATSPALLPSDVEKALRLPIGAASPLWMMIGAAAMLGVASYWTSRWMRPSMPVLEMPRLKAPPEPAQVEPVPVLGATSPEVEPLAGLVEPESVSEVLDPVVEAPVMVVALDAGPEAQLPEPAVPPSVAPVLEAVDDLTLLSGIGARLAQRLAERGVTRFAQIAALTPEQVATLDSEMKLMGRIDRDAWVAQARALADH